MDIGWGSFLLGVAFVHFYSLAIMGWLVFLANRAESAKDGEG